MNWGGGCGCARKGTGEIRENIDWQWMRHQKFNMQYMSGGVCSHFKFVQINIKWIIRSIVAFIPGKLMFFMINNAKFTDIFRTYKPITTYDQRCQYKRDFQSEYPEYIELKKNVDAVTMKFIELDRSWRRTEKESKDYFVRSVYKFCL